MNLRYDDAPLLLNLENTMTFQPRKREESSLVFSNQKDSAAFFVTGHLQAASHLREDAK